MVYTQVVSSVNDRIKNDNQPKGHMRSLLHYLIALIALFIYGTEVCPFLETLSAFQLGMPIAVALILQWLIRQPVQRLLQSHLPSERHSKSTLMTELGLFAFSGSMLMVYNTLVYGFPLESGLKVVVGFIGLGFFVAVDLALEQERNTAQHFHDTQRVLEPGTKLFPVSRKLALFSSASALLVFTVLFLVVNKDLHWLIEVSSNVSLHDAQSSILKEFIFVALLFLAQLLNVIYSYSRNLRFFFEAENGVLQRTNAGDLEGRVPVSTQDEFGVMAHHTNLMVEAIRQRTAEIQRIQDVTILSLASLAETRDNETGAHILRTQRYVRALAEYLSKQDRYREVLDEETIELLFKSAPLHDIGKVGIPDAILLKPGKLTDEEFEIMKTHATLGRDAILVAENELGSCSFLRFAKEIAENHHEKWDGSGYPQGLSGEAIPLSGRLMAVADVYDALISKRVYKPAFTHEKAKEIILEGRASHFDPNLVDAFIAIEEKFRTIASEYGDEHVKLEESVTVSA